MWFRADLLSSNVSENGGGSSDDLDVNGVEGGVWGRKSGGMAENEFFYILDLSAELLDGFLLLALFNADSKIVLLNLCKRLNFINLFIVIVFFVLRKI